MSPFFSIVIPLYNKENFVEQTIKSVLSQTFTDFEIIIVNDGSTDNSLSKAESINDNRISIFTIDNQGVSAARNFGAIKANSDYMCFLDADDLWKPYHLEDLKYLIEDYPNCGLYCTAYEKFFMDKTTLKSSYTGLDNNFRGVLSDYFHNSLVNQIASGSSVVIPKNTFETVGMFDLNLGSGQDTDLWIRIALKHKVVFTSKVSVTIIFSGNENHLSTSTKRKERVKILNKYIDFEKERPSFKKYMDLNRFSIVLDRKVNNDPIWKSIVKDIDYSNLNWKQKILLNSPSKLIKTMKGLQLLLIKYNIYLSPFK